MFNTLSLQHFSEDLFVRRPSLTQESSIGGFPRANDSIGMDAHIWLQLFIWQGPNMLAIFFKNGFKYGCNDNNKDLICLQSLSIRTKYACNEENRLKFT